MCLRVHEFLMHEFFFRNLTGFLWFHQKANIYIESQAITVLKFCFLGRTQEKKIRYLLCTQSNVVRVVGMKRTG